MRTIAPTPGIKMNLNFDLSVNKMRNFIRFIILPNERIQILLLIFIFSIDFFNLTRRCRFENFWDLR